MVDEFNRRTERDGFSVVANVRHNAPSDRLCVLDAIRCKRNFCSEVGMWVDSFGRKPSATFMPDLMHADITDPDLNQELESTRCGQLSMAWGHLYLNYGYAVAQMA